MSIDGILSEMLPIRICKANSMSGGLPDDESYNSFNHFLVSSVRSGLGWALGLELTVLKLGFHELINDVTLVAPFNHGTTERRNLHSPLFALSLFQGNSKVILIQT